MPVVPHPTSPTTQHGTLLGRLEQLFNRLAVDATQFDFYHVMRIIDAAVPGAVPLGRSPTPRDEPLRMTQHASLVFAPSTLHRYKPGGGARGLGLLSVYHFGLFGPNGALPQHLTEYVQERIVHNKDETLARFCDVFQHRMILLSYRAWADCQAVTSLDQPDRDPFARYAGSLAGLGQPALQHRDAVPDPLKLHHIGHLARQTRNPEGLVQPLVALLRVPVRVQEYCLQWLKLALEDRTRLISVSLAGAKSAHRIELGAASSRLGLGAIAGELVPDVQHKFRLLIGAMSLEEFERYLPGKIRFSQVRDWVRNYLGVELAWDARLILKREEVPAMQLGSYGQLGWTSWLGMPAGRRRCDADDVLLNMERLSKAHAVARDPQPKEDSHV